jgi:hypothetical protein
MNLYYRQAQTQRGMMLIMLLFVIGIASTFLVLHSLNSNSMRIERDMRTAAVMAEAKAALIGWSVARGEDGSQRPGELPCPDNDAPGTAGYGFDDGACVAGKVGRLPWKTLGIQEPLDGDGEVLWYAVDGAFRIRWGVATAAATNQPINIDTKASIQVFDTEGALLTIPGNEAAAVIFSAGAPLEGQSRGQEIAACAVTGTNIQQNECPSNYLEAFGGLNNAVNQGPYIAAAKSNQFNDKVTFVAGSALLSLVETRVAIEVQKRLKDYRVENGFYPYPAKFDDSNCLDVGHSGNSTSCQSDNTVCQGRLPSNANIVGVTPDWAGLNQFPEWFRFNLWGQTIVYAVDGAALAEPVVACATALSVDGAPVGALIVMPGQPLGAINRNLPVQSTNLSDYLEDIENQDAWDVMPETQFITPSAVANDKMILFP